MTPIVEQFIEALLQREGGYVNDPNDLGGETNWGITLEVARNYGYLGAMSAMPRSVATSIYREIYWYAPKFDQVFDISSRVAEELFDTGVNMGVGIAGQFLQRSLNALNDQGKHYADLVVDGQIGPGTLKALRSYFKIRPYHGESVLLKALNCLQGARYIELCEKREKNEAFLFGWLDDRVGLP